MEKKNVKRFFINRLIVALVPLVCITNAVTAQELIWDGSVHLGDEPGIYGEKSFGGLSTEFPIQLEKYASGTPEPQDDITLIIESVNVSIFSGYDAHSITVYGKKPSTATPNKWEEVVVGTFDLDAASVNLDLDPTKTQSIENFSIEIRLASDVAPGLYNDILIEKLSLQSSTHSASFGYRFGP